MLARSVILLSVICAVPYYRSWAIALIWAKAACATMTVDCNWIVIIKCSQSYRTEPMEISALAGKPALRNMLVDLGLLEGEYYVW